MAGGRLLETGAGGSAPKHVEQFLNEGHLRWDSLGEYLATAIGFQELGAKFGDGKLGLEEVTDYIFTCSAKATLLGDTLMDAVGIWLNNNRTPGRKVGWKYCIKFCFNVCFYRGKKLTIVAATSTSLSTGLSACLER